MDNSTVTAEIVAVAVRISIVTALEHFIVTNEVASTASIVASVVKYIVICNWDNNRIRISECGAATEESSVTVDDLLIGAES